MRQLQLPELTPDERHWRLDWLGEVAYPPRQLRFAQPSVQAWLSPLCRELDEFETLNSTEATELAYQRSVWLPIGSLPLLRTGSIWHKGEMVLNPRYQHATFIDVEIDPRTSCFIKAGLPLDDAYLLPLAEHPWHRKATQSYCISVGIGHGKRLIVPCLELIRFYFGSSSNLLGKLFTAPLREANLWTEKTFDDASRHLRLKLAQHLSGASASDIGRIALDKSAWHSAAGIYDSCVKASSQHQRVYPYTHFPFCGKTTLRASGRWLSFDSQRDMTFVVYQLLSCSHPFPFSSLSYETDAGRQMRTTAGSVNSADPRPAYVASSPVRKHLCAGGDADRNKQPQTLSITRNIKFPDLLKKSVWLDKVAISHPQTILVKNTGSNIELVAFGDPQDDSPNRAVDLAESASFEANTIGQEKLPAFMWRGLKEFRKQLPSSIEIQTLRMPGHQKSVFPLPLLVDENGEINTICFWTAPDGTHRQRRAGIFRAHTPTPLHMAIIEGQELKSAPVIFAIAEPNIDNLIKGLIETPSSKTR